MRILKLILFTITLALACSVSYGQAPTKVAFGGTRPIDTAWAGRHLRIDSTVRFLKYSTSDATKYLRINASGFLELGTPAGGGGNADSATFFTNYRADTMRSNIYGQLGLKGTVTNVSTGFGMLGGPITTTGTVRVDSNYIMTVLRGYKIVDSVAGLIPSVTGYVPYTGATQTLNLGTQNLITDTITGTGSGGLHLHGSASNSGIQINPFGEVRLDQYPITNSGDSVLTTNSNGYIQVYNLKGNYVPYNGATNNLNMGNYGVTAKRANLDTLEPNSSAGLHLHNTSHQDIFIAGAGGGQNLTIYAPTSFSLMANQSETDTVLGSTSTGLVKKIGIATTYLKKSDTVSLSNRIDEKGNGTVTSVGVVAGTGVSIGGTSPITTSGTYTITNTAPDQTVSLTGAGTVSVTGTYPTFTVTGTGGSGSVTSITSTNNSILVSGTTTVNVMVDTTKATQWTVDQTIDSANIGTGNGLSTNIRFGRTALAAVTTGTRIVALGEATANKITTGTDIVLVGHNAGANTSVSVNGLVGVGRNNLNFSTGDNNTALGSQCMARAVAWNGIANVGIGANSGNALTSGSSNSWLGAGAANALTSGSSNVLLGVNSGNVITTGGSNVVLGSYTGNAGGLDIRTSSNRMVLSDGAGNIRAYHTGTNWLIGTVTDGSTGILQLSGNLGLNTAGNKLNIATGSQASVGTGTLATGTATILTTAVTASSIIQVQLTSCSSCGTLYISAQLAGTSFTVTSTNGADASTFNYWIIN